MVRPETALERPEEDVVLRIDPKYGGVYAGASFDISPAAAEHFNAAARRAGDVLPGEFRDFEPGEVFSIACPSFPTPKRAFVEAYNRLTARIDAGMDVHLGDYPHLFSTAMGDLAKVRAAPTYVPKSAMPDGFFGRTHTVEILQDGKSIFGPVERFFHTQTSGVVFEQIEDGHGRLVVEIRGDMSVLSQRGEVVLFTDPRFGDPTGVIQLNDDGSSTPVAWDLLGRDCVGDVELFVEWVAVGVRPQGRSVVLEIHLPNPGSGLAVALYSGHTRATAFRVDATVLPG